MPSSEPDTNNYQQKYRNLKRKLKILIYENECYHEELKKAQKKLLNVSRDKSFLLDRLLKYENVESSSSDSEATLSSDSDNEFRAELMTLKKKRNTAPVVDNHEGGASNSVPNNVANSEVKKKKSRKTCPAKPGIKMKKKENIEILDEECTDELINAPEKDKDAKKNFPKIQEENKVFNEKRKAVHLYKEANVPQSASNVIIETLTVSHGDGHMTSEEIERHLETKQSLRDLIPEKTPLTVPVELFSNEPSVMECEIIDGQVSDISPNNVVENVGIMIDIHE